MDFLSECTTDREREDALSNLPPTLASSYDRILERANRCTNRRVPLLVSRTLQWLYFRNISQLGFVMQIPALLVAVAVEEGDTDIPLLDRLTTESDLLNWCSSLVCKMDDKVLVFSHFTVQDLLAYSRCSRHPITQASG